MVTRRTVLAVAAAAMLSGCASEDSAVPALQKRYGAEAGVSSVTLSTFTPNEAMFTKNVEGDATLAEDTTTEQQTALVGRFFEYALAAGLTARHLASITFHLPHGSSATVRFMMLDGAQSADVVRAVAAVPGASTTVEVGAPLPWIRIASTVSRDVAQDILASATLVAGVPYGKLFSTEVSVSDRKTNPYTVVADHQIGAGELRFAAEVQAWLTAHPTDGLILPFSTSETARIAVRTVADESAGVRALGTSARAAGIKNRIDAYRTDSSAPYLSIPRG